MTATGDRDGAHQARGLHAGTVARPNRGTKPPWITVSGGKGGVGKTLLSVNLALLLARSGRRVLLCDLDPGLGDVHVHLRVAPRHALEDLIAGRCTPAQSLTPLRQGLALVSGRSGSAELASGDRAYLSEALAAVDEAAASHDADLVLCDTGAGIGPSVLAAGRRAARTLAVTTSDPAAVTDVYALLKLFDQEAIPAPQLVINRVRSREEAMRTASRLGEVCRRFLGHGIETAGWLHDSPDLERSIREQQPFVEVGTGPALEDLQALSAAIAAGVVPRRRPAATRAAASAQLEARQRTVETLRRLVGPQSTHAKNLPTA